jgi:putative transposase
VIDPDRGRRGTLPGKEDRLVSTFYSLHYHWICSTKHRRPLIRSDWRPCFHQYLGGTVRGLDGVALEIGGVEDHVHLLVGLKTTHCLADFSRELKKASSIWASSHGDADFAWQEGYTVFTVSRSQVESVREYLRGQEEHHRKLGFAEELRTFLERHGIAYDERSMV